MKTMLALKHTLTLEKTKGRAAGMGLASLPHPQLPLPLSLTSRLRGLLFLLSLNLSTFKHLYTLFFGWIAAFSSPCHTSCHPLRSSSVTSPLESMGCEGRRVGFVCIS